MNDSKWLTVGARNLVLRINKSKSKQITWAEPGGWWVDNHRTNGRLAMELLRLCLLRSVYKSNNERDHYEIFALASDAVSVATKDTEPLFISALREHRKNKPS